MDVLEHHTNILQRN
jgi:hypothetical protein